MKTKLISTATAAVRLGLSVRRVQQLVAGGTLPGLWIGRTLVIDAADLPLADARVKKPGRVPKAS